ncbi:SDR family oxidoreductase [Dactylosporangium sp. NPDC005572]|uniref:SDR family oxidoreductase n=1 Tax=Dactylosporangium sp. NPDC005572 TaxID=3156889 RepID=UPI0033A76156
MLVVIGTGGMGLAAARRMGSGRQIVLADSSTARLAAAARDLQDAGHTVNSVVVDVADAESVRSLAKASRARGHIDAVVHTAGVSPNQASVERIYVIDLVGTAYVIDAFLDVAEAGTVVTCIASVAGHRHRLPDQLEQFLAIAPADQLLAGEQLDLSSTDGSRAYAIAKRGVQLRVREAAAAFGARGARINSVSPGIVHTQMSQHEFAGPHGDEMRAMIANQPIARVGTPDDIAAAVAFLSSSVASYITGTDLLVDGGTLTTLPSED